jgi:hypothetical protein
MEVVYCIGMGFVLGLLVGLAAANGDRYNEHAHMLGKVVEARKYDGSDWERCVVVAVSWHGSLCVRPCAELERRGWWMDAKRAATHVREVA